MPRELSAVDIQQLVDRYVAGEWVSALAREVGAHSTFLYPHLKRLNIPVRQDRVRHHQRPAIVGLAERFHAGESVLSLSKRYGVSRSVITHRLRALGLTPRGQSETERIKWSRMTARARSRQVRAAHEAVRGHPKSMAARCALALARERRGFNQPQIGAGERALFAMLTERGLTVRPQAAIGPYNCDLAVDAVAVEVFGGNWHWCGSHGARLHPRTRYLLNRGWHVYIVVVSKCFPLVEAVADDLLAFVQRTSRDPTGRREYRVIRGDAQLLSSGDAQDNHLAIKPSLNRSAHSAHRLGHHAHVAR